MKGPPKKDWDYVRQGSEAYVSKDAKPSDE